MIKNCIPERLWDYGYQWVCNTNALTYTTAGNPLGNGCIPLAQVTGETPDISEFLDFGLYDRVWFKDNAGAPAYEPGR